MGFTSLEFLLFFPLVFSFFYLFKNEKAKRWVLLFANVIFYGWWDYRFLLLIFISTIADYSFSLKMENSKKPKQWLYASIFVNLSLLGFFKYYDFFINSFRDSFTFFGYSIDDYSLNIIVPVGISFYTFQTLSYTIDVYKKRIKPSKDFLSFAIFVSYFPQLVAGPIERAGDLLPQIEKLNKKFNYPLAVEGMKQMLFGFVKKIVIADQISLLINKYFAAPENYSGIDLIFGIVLFAFQLYCDFSGYSDIAIGGSKLFGIKLSKNFNVPYFSRSMREGFTRWHITLTNWFRDYVYFELPGNLRKKSTVIKNTLIVFFLTGLWHGADWKYVITFLLHGIFMIVPLILGIKRVRRAKHASIKELPAIVFNFCLLCVPFVFFRADSLSDAMIYYKTIATNLFVLPKGDYNLILVDFIILFVFVLLEWKMRKRNHSFDFTIKNKAARYMFYSAMALLILNNFGDSYDFIYFQF